MVEYLEFMFVALVIGLVISITARLVTGGILYEIQRYKKARAEEVTKSINEVTDKIVKSVKDYYDEKQKDEEFRKKMRELV